MRKLTVDDSSNVISVTFREPGVLDVQFSSGATYRYLNCTLDDFASCCHAPSVGRWVQEALVRQKTKHPFERVSPVVADPPRVDQKLVALQVIASLPNPKPDQRSVVRIAREALEGVAPPPLPVELEPPRVPRDGEPRLILWSPGQAMHLRPDEARGVGYAMLTAALEAES